MIAAPGFRFNPGLKARRTQLRLIVVPSELMVSELLSGVELLHEGFI